MEGKKRRRATSREIPDRKSIAFRSPLFRQTVSAKTNVALFKWGDIKKELSISGYVILSSFSSSFLQIGRGSKMFTWELAAPEPEH